MTQANGNIINLILLYKAKVLSTRTESRDRIENESNDVEDREHGKGGTNTKRTD